MSLVLSTVDPANQCAYLKEGCCVEENNNDGEDDCSFLKVVRAVYDYRANSDVELEFFRGDKILIHSECNDGWWWGEIDGQFGYVPVTYISSNLGEEWQSDVDWQNDSYFDIYGQLTVQHEMLSDRARTLSYLTAIRRNAKWILDSTVMDIGCGTGILSLFVARDGKAKTVYAVEASSIHSIARDVVIANGYEDQIKVIAEMVEDLDIPEKVDLIVSEWMGTLLISEFMIESVIKARDKFLKSGGKLWPSRATLYIAPCSSVDVYESAVGFWNNVYGFDFSVVNNKQYDNQTGKPLHSNISKEEDILAKPASVLDIDMETVTIENIEYVSSKFNFLIDRPGIFNGFCTWFSALFDGLSDGNESSTLLDTGPYSQTTHWKHPLLFMDTHTVVAVSDEISGTVEIIRNREMRRHLSLKIRSQIVRENKVISQFEKSFCCWE